jgi:hypothetical protein
MDKIQINNLRMAEINLELSKLDSKDYFSKFAISKLES